ncbi:uncharacterized protein Z520_01154 [Fonsecaea multimorphosa CBS 102226]|uniref:Uncharacterized protein n=1 Tax=Fonsecaea multimorphosa CBS 102226 TaxID=1442371 RepID=A0A0D2L0X6_9EURO|nr:uncharacterized protein Z520_01154 [Fonsecaea multimorphosa CBS 102226]KIY02689.1 hypothetical protein Z520_01154 [Fonsecaea multimorphosa CBS 102226]OAL31551.1 hypothetical protein AYO22_01143 [Fonsecaea multimorphosa]
MVCDTLTELTLFYRSNAMSYGPGVNIANAYIFSVNGHQDSAFAMTQHESFANIPTSTDPVPAFGITAVLLQNLLLSMTVSLASVHYKAMKKGNERPTAMLLGPL